VVPDQTDHRPTPFAHVRQVSEIHVAAQDPQPLMTQEALKDTRIRAVQTVCAKLI